MLSTHLQATVPVRRPLSSEMIHNTVSRLFAAAVVSREFRETLLRDPRAALRQGYLGQPFHLTDEEERLVCSIRAVSLTDLARQVNRALKSL